MEGDWLVIKPNVHVIGYGVGCKTATRNCVCFMDKPNRMSFDDDDAVVFVTAAIFVLYGFYFLQLNMFVTLRYLGLIGLPTFLCGNKLLSGIAARRSVPSSV